MSKHETWRTRAYWDSVGGLLIEEFLAVRGSASENIGKRLIDGVIVKGESTSIHTGGQHDLSDKDIIVVQTKATRLGMYLMGQALFSAELMKQFNPRSTEVVAICGNGDPVMEEICKRFGIGVVVMSDEDKLQD